MSETNGRLADGAACLEAALVYLARGWSVLPLCPPDHVGVGKEHAKRCQSKGKAPLISWKEYQQRLPTEDEVRGWWKRWPNANVGIVLGSVSGLVGIDLDGPGGEELLAKVASGRLPPSLEFRTPGGGRRLLYQIGKSVRLQVQVEKAAAKEELRFLAEGTQTVAPPSRHLTGGVYQWICPPTTPHQHHNG